MINRRLIIRCILLVIICYSSFLFDQEKKLEKLRVGGGSTSAMQMSLWLAKEGNYYEEKPFPKDKGGAKPEDFADSRFVRELDQSGFIKSLFPNR
jgi:hypothetical protein